MRRAQGVLFESRPSVSTQTASTFIDNLKLPVHRWFRYSAGFSAEWVEAVIRENASTGAAVRVLDPFAGSGTTLIAAEHSGVPCYGIEAHPFVLRVAEAKLAWRSDPEAYKTAVRQWTAQAAKVKPKIDKYPELIQKC